MRLTASNFGAICHRTVRRNCDKLCSTLLSPPTLRNAAVVHGKMHEMDAVKGFSSVTGLKVQKCGLFVSSDYPFLAATPDGLVNDSHVLEVKCPFGVRNQKIEPGPAFPFLESQNDDVCVKKQHRYYDQIQGQMALAKRKRAYFVVFTFVDIKVIEEHYDEEFWKESMVPKLTSFYNNHFRKYVASHL